MGGSRIRFDYDLLSEIARLFGSESEAGRQTLQLLQREVSTLEQGDWIGPGARAFYAEMRGQVLPSLQRLADAMTDAQRGIGQISLIARQAEDEAATVLRRSAAVGQAAGSSGQARAAAIAGSTDSDAASIARLAGAMSWASSPLGGMSGILKGFAMNFNPTLLKTFEALNRSFPDLIKYFPGRWALVALTPDIARRQSSVAMLLDTLSGRAGRGLWQVRFDQPHANANFPHINFNMKPDPHTRIPPALLEAAGKAPSWLGKVGKAAPWLAAGLDAIRLGEAFHEDGNQIGARTARTVGSVAGGWAGAWVGAEGGAVVGFAIGSIFPGPGNAIGGFVGAIGGGILGGLGGSSLGEGLVSLFQ